MTLTLPDARLAELVAEAHRHTLGLVADLDEQQLTVPRLDNVNPFRWELGHVAFFYDIFFLRGRGSGDFLLDGADRLYDSFRVDHADRWGLPLPSRQETIDYKERVLERVVGSLERSEPSEQETYLALLTVLHEDMHGEAFTCTRQTLGYVPPPLEGSRGASALDVATGPHPGDVEIPGGTFMLGATPDLPFVWDNEKWAHPVEVPPFRMAVAPVTNAEFAAFVEDRGYLRPELWSVQGWTWRVKTGAVHPLYWVRGDGGWMRRHFERVVPVESSAPVVHVNWHEAEAYCAWAGRRLPTEAEWELAASGEPDGDGLSPVKRRYPWGDEAPTPARANLDSRLMGVADVAAFPAGDSAFGCRQMLGNVWEWTSSPFYPFPGYVVDSPYREYSAPWFGYPMVLKGGAWATRSRLVTNTYRNFFWPHRRDVIAGFRTVAL